MEAVYQEALAIEMALREIPFRREVQLPVFYKGRRLQTTYRADFICFDSIIVELKALSRIGRIEEAQIINYLKVTGYELGLLLNFGEISLVHRRFANNKTKSAKKEEQCLNLSDERNGFGGSGG